MLVGAQGVGLPATAVQGDHQLAPQPLAERMPGGQALELADHGRVGADRQVGVDAVLDGGEPGLGQPHALGPGPPLRGQAGERFAAHEVERCPQVDDRAARIVREPGPRPGHELVEPFEVGAEVVRREGVAGIGRRDRLAGKVGGEAPAQARDQDLQRVGRLPGRVVAVEDVDQAVRGHDLAALDRQGGQQQLQLLARHRHDRAVVGDDLDGPEQSDLHEGPRYRPRRQRSAGVVAVSRWETAPPEGRAAGGPGARRSLRRPRARRPRS